jgi:hypothetical protein
MYEGFVTHENNSAVNGEANLTFTLYAVESGGTALYQETQTLVVRYGNVSAEIGIVEPIDLSLFRDNADLYVGVAVEDEPELSPRLRLAARPYAASAAYAGDALALQGLGPDDLLIGATPPAANVTYDNTGTGLTATTSQEAINALLARIEMLESETAQLRQHLQSQIDGNADAIESLELVTEDQENRITLLEGQVLDARLTAVEGKTASMFVSKFDGQSAVVFTGVNVVIQNGTGSTSTTDGTGNLVIGYNSMRSDGTDARAGSHNLVLGDENSHTSAAYGSLLSGHHNDIQNAYTATVAGSQNLASGYSASVAGGYGNTASGRYASVAGGRDNTASDNSATVAGGRNNKASFLYASVAGGQNNEASFLYASVAGGYHNEASGNSASVAGGQGNTAGGSNSAVAGGALNTALGSESAVAGGVLNTASGNFSTVSGGYSRTVAGEHDWRAGECFQEQ